MYYGTPKYERFLRTRVPYYKNKGLPEARHIGYKTDLKTVAKGNFSIVKTRREIADEYNRILERSNSQLFRGVGCGISTAIATAGVLFFGATWVFPVALITGIYAVSFYWKSAATYSNFTNWENAPVVFPMRNVYDQMK